MSDNRGEPWNRRDPRGPLGRTAEGPGWLMQMVGGTYERSRGLWESHSLDAPDWGLLGSGAQVVEDAPEASRGIPPVLAVRAMPQNPTSC